MVLNHKKNVILAILVFLCFSNIHGQIFFRIEADFSLKEKNSDGTQKLTMGKVYYDKHIKKIVYLIKFPEPEILVVKDTIIYRIVNHKIVQKIPSLNITDFSIYNLCLNGDLPYFGLKNSPYRLTNIEKDSNMVITTWELPKMIAPNKGKLLLSQVDRKLNGLISMGIDDRILSKQFFRNYTKISGFEFPAKVIHYIYINSEEEIKISTYKNIKINNLENENYYNYPIPGF